MLEVRSIAMDAPRNEITTTAWEKRVGTDDEDTVWSTNEAHRKDNPGGDPGPNDELYVYNSNELPGYNSDDMFRSESPWDAEVMGSDGRGPDPHYNEMDLGYSDDEDRGANPDHMDGVAKPNEFDGEDDDGTDIGNYLDHDHDHGYDGDDEKENGSDIGHNEQGSVGLGPVPEHPATPERPEHIPVSDLEKLFSLGPRPRNFGSGIVGTTKSSKEPLRTSLTLPLQTEQPSHKCSNPHFSGQGSRFAVRPPPVVSSAVVLSRQYTIFLSTANLKTERTGFLTGSSKRRN